MSTTRSFRTRLALVTAAGLALVAVFGGSLPAQAAGKKTTTLHFFEKQVTDEFFHANGQPATQDAQPAPGDYFIDTSLDYVGNHTKHAKKATVSDTFSCTIAAVTQTTFTGTCYGAFAIDGDLLLASHVNLTFDFTAGSVTVPITGGTGRFKGATGTVTAKDVGTTNNSDITIRYTV